MEFKELEQKLNEVGDKVTSVLDELIPNPQGILEAKLYQAMRYSALNGGKRLRPFLTYITSQLFGVSQDSAMYAAVAIELIHTYSLIHDDLPAMDNDDYRRGQPSCHKKFGEATAILAGDGLLTYVFEILSDELTHRDPSVRVELISAIAKASGFAGMVGGQSIDMITENQELEFSEIVRLQRMKTGMLFAISCEAGAILGKAPRNLRSSLRAYANNLGLAFQITDDLLDAEGTRKETGKTVRKDQRAGKSTLVALLGVEQARAHARMLSEQAIEHVSSFREQAKFHIDLAKYVVNRTK